MGNAWHKFDQVHFVNDYLSMCPKTEELVANSVDSDHTKQNAPRSVASDEGLHCILRPFYPNINPCSTEPE